jgi:hypothetical protein
LCSWLAKLKSVYSTMKCHLLLEYDWRFMRDIAH